MVFICTDICARTCGLVCGIAHTSARMLPVVLAVLLQYLWTDVQCCRSSDGSINRVVEEVQQGRPENT